MPLSSFLSYKTIFLFLFMLRKTALKAFFHYTFLWWWIFFHFYPLLFLCFHYCFFEWFFRFLRQNLFLFSLWLDDWWLMVLLWRLTSFLCFFLMIISFDNCFFLSLFLLLLFLSFESSVAQIYFIWFEIFFSDLRVVFLPFLW